MVVWGIGSDDPLDALTSFANALGLTYPILHDRDGSVHTDYSMTSAFPTAAYPQDWIVGADGRIVYANNAYEPSEIRAVIEREIE